MGGGGKSGLRRARCRITSGRGDPTESGTEKTRPVKAKVKWRGKSAPAIWRHIGLLNPIGSKVQYGEDDAARRLSRWNRMRVRAIASLER
jgi:hypothetical protein